MKKNLSLIAIFSILWGCGNYYKKPESIEAKMARYESKDLSINDIPSFKATEAHIKKTKSRMPASADQEEIGESNKSVYFMSLHTQYQAMGDLYPEHKKSLKMCPTFHQEILKAPVKTTNWSQREDIDFKNSIVKSFNVKNKSELSIAMKNYMNSTFNELSILCDRGYSSNYYIYENFITLAAKKGVVTKDVNGINALLKTSIFFNDTLLKTIANEERIRKKSRGLASSESAPNYPKEALRRLKASWATDLLK